MSFSARSRTPSLILLFDCRPRPQWRNPGAAFDLERLQNRCTWRTLSDDTTAAETIESYGEDLVRSIRAHSEATTDLRAILKTGRAGELSLRNRSRGYSIYVSTSSEISCFSFGPLASRRPSAVTKAS